MISSFLSLEGLLLELLLPEEPELLLELLFELPDELLPEEPELLVDEPKFPFPDVPEDGLLSVLLSESDFSVSESAVSPDSSESA